MEEVKRVLCDRKFIGMLILLLLVNGWLVWRELQPDAADMEYYTERYGENYEEEEREIYRELMTRYRTMDTEAALSDMEECYDTWECGLEESGWEEEDEAAPGELKENVRLLIREQAEYILGYGDYLTDIRDTAEERKQISVLGAEGSFSGRNLDKIVEDYSSLENIELKLDNERAVDAYRDCTFTEILMLVMPATVVLILLEERKKGLWQFVYAMPKGRTRLAFIRCLLIFLTGVVTGILLEGETLVLTGVYHGGFGDLSRAVQSNPSFSGCVLKISMGTWLFLTVLIKILVCTLTGMIFWCVASFCKSHVTVFGILAVLTAGEYTAYAGIAQQSVWNKLKYINLFSFLDSGNTLAMYLNLNVSGYPVGVSTLVMPAVLVLLCLACILVISGGRKRPFQPKESILTRGYEKILFRVKPYRHNSLLLHEGYKLLVRQRCVVLLIILAYMCMNMFDTEEIMFDYRTTIYNNYLQQIEGELTDEKTAYLKAEKNIWKDKIEKSQEKTEQYELLLEQGAETEEYEALFSSYDAYQQEKKKIENWKLAETVVDELLEEAVRLEQLQAEGMKAGFVNRISYDMYIGKRGKAESMKEAVLILAFLCAALAGVQSYERSQNAEKLIRSTKNGRKILQNRKNIWSCIVAFIILVMVTAVGFYNIRTTYGMKSFGMAAQSLELLQDFPLPFSIGGTLLFLWVLRYLVLASVAGIILYISGRTKNIISSLMWCVLVIMVPAGLVYMGFSRISFISVLYPVMVTCFWNDYGFQGVMWWLPCVMVWIIGRISMHLVNKGEIVRLGAAYGKKSGV